MSEYWRKRSYEQDATRVAAVMGAALFAGCIVAAVGAWRVPVAGLLWAGACSAIGWLLGFLFGIPRSLANAGANPTDTPNSPQPQIPSPLPKQPVVGQQQEQRALPEEPVAGQPTPGPTEPGPEEPKKKLIPSSGVNTNLEQISDWLTKIIVGVTLVEVKPALAQLDDAAKLVAVSMGDEAMKSFAYALIIYFSVTGFLGSYLLTRLFLQRAFSEVDTGP